MLKQLGMFPALKCDKNRQKTPDVDPLLKSKISPHFMQTDTKSKFCQNFNHISTIFCLYFIQIWAQILLILRNYLSKLQSKFCPSSNPNFEQITSKQGTRTLRIKWTKSGQKVYNPLISQSICLNKFCIWT